MADATTHQILCNACKVPPEPVPDSEPETWRCLSCGHHDTRENILGQAREHAKEVIARNLQNRVRKTARKSRILQFTGKPIPHGSYRFITDLEAGE